jgi:hypothetical protein
MVDYDNIVFLDVDGVLNCQLHYHSEEFQSYRNKSKKELEEETLDDYHLSQISKERVEWLNGLCKNTNSVVVVSSTWRHGRSIEDLQELFDKCGGTFKVIGKTGSCGCRIRGVEIHEWLKKNIDKEEHGVHYFDYYSYVILDDDSDMLLNQGPHFFQTDTYSGLTPNTCYRAERFLTKKMFKDKE